MGMLMLPVILLVLVVALLFSTVSSTITTVANGGSVMYDEAVFQDYAYDQYDLAFHDSGAYEDNLLIVFLVNEERDGYYTIAFIGDNVRDEINYMFGNEYSEFGSAMQSSISDYYAHSISANLAAMINKMTDEVTALDLESSFRKESTPSSSAKAELVNDTDLRISDETVGDALNAFTEQTGIPVVLVVEDMETVFGKALSPENIFTIILLIGAAALCIFFIVRAGRKRKEAEENGSNSGRSDYDSNNRSQWR